MTCTWIMLSWNVEIIREEKILQNNPLVGMVYCVVTFLNTYLLKGCSTFLNDRVTSRIEQIHCMQTTHCCTSSPNPGKNAA